MNVNSTIVSALSPAGYPVEPMSYTGKEKKYFIFNYADDRGEVFADNEPQIDVASIQIHFFCPGSPANSKFNYKTVIQQTRVRLLKAGFSYPVITEIYEKETGTNHIIFECSIDGQSETEE
jgi:hypothetical protein